MWMRLARAGFARSDPDRVVADTSSTDLLSPRTVTTIALV
jgi:hypothetical protein